MTLQPILQGETVYLSAIQEGDVNQFVTWMRDPNFIRMTDENPAIPHTGRDTRDWFDKIDKMETWITLTIRSKKDHRLIGIAELHSILWNQQVASLGLGIGNPGDRGKGYGREATRLIVDFAFHELNLRRVQLTVFSYNESAIRLYEKLGFQREATYREALYRAGQRYDMYLYGMLRREWTQGFLENPEAQSVDQAEDTPSDDGPNEDA